jgi:metalloprotease
MKAKLLLVTLGMPLLMGCSVLEQAGFGDMNVGDMNIGQAQNAISAGQDIIKAAQLSDDEVKKVATEFARYSDSSNKIAPSKSIYTSRLAKLTKNHQVVDGVKFNYKVYVSPDLNAFSLADGTIRIYSGLMDMLTDAEVLAVLGHEIGHVMQGHSKDRLRVAYAASAAKKSAAAAVAPKAGILGQMATAELAGLVEQVVNAQFSQSQEEDADDYGLKFLKSNGYNSVAAVSALRKLAEVSSGHDHGVLSSHPDPLKRARRLLEQLKKTVPAKAKK